MIPTRVDPTEYIELITGETIWLARCDTTLPDRDTLDIERI
jgi:hypothetical protein